MKVRKVTDIGWSGINLNAYAIVKDGPLRDDSILSAATLYLLDRAQRGKGEKSQKANAEDICSFFNFLDKNKLDWSQATQTNITTYLHEELQKNRNVKEKTIKRHISTLSGFFQYAWATGLLNSKPMFSYNYQVASTASKDKETKATKFSLRTKYINHIIFNEIKAGVTGSSPFVRERDELVLELGYLCGLRASEVTDARNLCTSDLKKKIKAAEDNKISSISIKIFGKGDKLRIVDVPPKAVRLIENFMLGRRSRLSDGPLICSSQGAVLSETHATDVFKRAKRSAESRVRILLKNPPQQISFLYFIDPPSYSALTYHSLRHTYATNLVDFCYRHGIDPWQYVPEQMGHSDRSTTRVYIVFEAMIHRREKILKALESEET